MKGKKNHDIDIYISRNSRNFKRLQAKNYFHYSMDDRGQNLKSIYFFFFFFSYYRFVIEAFDERAPKRDVFRVARIENARSTMPFSGKKKKKITDNRVRLKSTIPIHKSPSYQIPLFSPLQSHWLFRVHS